MITRRSLIKKCTQVSLISINVVQSPRWSPRWLRTSTVSSFVLGCCLCRCLEGAEVVLAIQYVCLLAAVCTLPSCYNPYLLSWKLKPNWNQLIYAGRKINTNFFPFLCIHHANNWRPSYLGNCNVINESSTESHHITALYTNRIRLQLCIILKRLTLTHKLMTLCWANWDFLELLPFLKYQFIQKVFCVPSGMFTLLVKKQQTNEADEATNRHPISSACLIMISQLYASVFTDT